MTQMEIIQAALGQAFWCDVSLQEVVQIAHNSETPESFALKIHAFSAYTEEPEEGELVIEFPV